jgi:hypothetical protein
MATGARSCHRHPRGLLSHEQKRPATSAARANRRHRPRPVRRVGTDQAGDDPPERRRTSDLAVFSQPAVVAHIVVQTARVLTIAQAPASHAAHMQTLAGQGTAKRARRGAAVQHAQVVAAVYRAAQHQLAAACVRALPIPYSARSHGWPAAASVQSPLLASVTHLRTMTRFKHDARVYSECRRRAADLDSPVSCLGSVQAWRRPSSWTELIPGASARLSTS